MKGDPVRVLLLDDHAVVRRGLRLVLELERDLEVCGEAGSLREVLEFEGEPDVVLVDLILGDARGQEVVKEVRERFPDAALLVLTMVDNPMEVHLAFEAGADGYMAKEAAANDLVDAVRRVAGGESYLHPSLGASVARYQAGAGVEGPRLTKREAEVLRLLALGHTNAETASVLGVAKRTIEAHRERIREKLDLKTRAEMVRYATEAGLIRGSR